MSDKSIREQSSRQPRCRSAASSLAAALALAAGALLASCGPARHPTPSLEETGASRAGPSSLAVANQPGPAPAVDAVHTPAPVAPAVQPAPPPPVERVTPPWLEERSTGTAATPLPAPPASELGFVNGFADQVATYPLREPKVILVLPPFELNTLFQRWETSQLGEEIADETLRRLSRVLSGGARLLSPALFERVLRDTNRSLADVDTPESARALAQRVGARYLVSGRIDARPGDITIRLEASDVYDLLPVASASWTFRAGTPEGTAIHARYRDGAGRVIPGALRFGALAPETRPSLQAELQLLTVEAVHRLLDAAGETLSPAGGAGLAIAVLPVQVPGEIAFQKLQRALSRETSREKERFVALGMSEAQALGQGPVRILGQTYKTLQEAVDEAATKDFERKISDTGRLRDTLSRLIFDVVEDAGERRGVKVIPHDQIVDQVVLFQKEEAEKVREGILANETREFFKTQGAGALLFCELIESGDAYDLVFQLRRADDSRRLAPPLTRYLEPRFAVQLDDVLTK